MEKLRESDLRSFAAWWRSEGRSETTLKEYLRQLRRYFGEYEGANTLTLTEVREYVNSELARSRSQGRMAARALKAFSKWQADEYEESDPLAKLKMPKDDTPDPNRTKVAQPDEVSRILDAITKADDHFSKRDHAIVSVLACTGMRRSELARMRWEDVDLVEGTITIPKTKNKGLPRELVTPDLACLSGRPERMSKCPSLSLASSAVTSCGLPVGVSPV